MQLSFDEIRQMAHALPGEQRLELADSLYESVESAEAFAAWQKEVGEPEPGYDEWFRKGVEEALADESGDVPHEEAMKQFHEAIRRARKLKRSA